MHKINTKTLGINTKPKGNTLKHPKTTRFEGILIETRSSKSNRSKMNRTSKNINRREAEMNTKMPEVRHRIIRKSFSKFQNKMATVRSQISEFEIEEFFRSLEALLSNSLHDNISFDTAEFLYRRLDGFERNISVLLARLRESFPAEEQ